jgi:hypothetical protein
MPVGAEFGLRRRDALRATSHVMDLRAIAGGAGLKVLKIDYRPMVDRLSFFRTRTIAARCIYAFRFRVSLGSGNAGSSSPIFSRAWEHFDASFYR